MNKRAYIDGYLHKEAGSKWAKIFPFLSPKDQKRLIQYLPQSTTRQIGKKPIGYGGEGKIFKSVTGQVGDTVSKVHYDAPMTRSRKITGGAAGFKGWDPTEFKPSADWDTKLDIFKENPELFPKTYGTTGRGYIMERLQDIPKEEVAEAIKMGERGPFGSLKRKLQKLITGYVKPGQGTTVSPTLKHKGKGYGR